MLWYPALQVHNSDKTPLLTCILEGPAGSGKSAMAATAAMESEYPFIKVISPETLVGYAEQVGGALEELSEHLWCFSSALCANQNTHTFVVHFTLYCDVRL